VRDQFFSQSDISLTGPGGGPGDKLTSILSPGRALKKLH